MEKDRHMSKKIDIISQYLHDYTSSFSGREIARKLKINHQTALNHLRELVQTKILFIKDEGRNKKYSLDNGALKTKLYLQLAESYSALKSLDKFHLKKVVEILLPVTEIVIVFGSFAKGLEKEHSDIDIVAINTINKEQIKDKLKILPREVNIEFISWKNFETSYRGKKALAREIEKNHLLYGNIYKIINLYCS